MMDLEEFRKRGHELVDWMADYFSTIESHPVKPDVRPGEIIAQLPPSPPETSECFDVIFSDFQNVIMPGVTHWQHPGFMAYFNANNSFPSVLAEMLTATIGAQCMIWQTSPAAAELEERVMEWTRELIGLPDNFTGVIQDTASTATLCSLLTARETFSEWNINEHGVSASDASDHPLIVYCSSEAHSSIEKAVKIAGLGREHLRKIPVDHEYALIPEQLETAILQDIATGNRPLAVIAAMGTTGSSAVDPIDEIGTICQRHGIWLHVDAAYAGTGLVLPELRWMSKGIEKADSFVFNPHKWMFTNFDCSAYFVKDPEALIRTFEILPEYLKTRERGEVNDYRDWGVPLGRRFRALKLWFVLRSFGSDGIRAKVRDHIEWARELAEEIDSQDDFEVLAPVPLALICFRYVPPTLLHDQNGSSHPNEPIELNEVNARLLEAINSTGKLYLTHTKLDDRYCIRINIGQTNVERRHVEDAWELVRKTAREITP